MVDVEKNNGGTPKHSRFRKSTVASGSGKSDPVLPMFVQMNVQFDGVDKSWREASR